MKFYDLGPISVSSLVSRIWLVLNIIMTFWERKIQAKNWQVCAKTCLWLFQIENGTNL